MAVISFMQCPRETAPNSVSHVALEPVRMNAAIPNVPVVALVLGKQTAS